MPSTCRARRSGSLGIGLFSLHQPADVARRRRYHGFDHEAGLWHAHRNRRLADGRDGDAYANREYLGEGRIALVLVDENEAARIGEAFDAAHRFHAAEGRQHHRVGEWDFVTRLV